MATRKARANLNFGGYNEAKPLAPQVVEFTHNGSTQTMVKVNMVGDGNCLPYSLTNVLSEFTTKSEEFKKFAKNLRKDVVAHWEACMLSGDEVTINILVMNFIVLHNIMDIEKYLEKKDITKKDVIDTYLKYTKRRKLVQR